MGRATAAVVAATALAAVGRAATLADICTTSYVQAVLPANGTIPGITFDSSAITAAVTNSTRSASYCQIQLAYSHDGSEDQVLVAYALPDPSAFKNRYLSTGGGGFAITSGTAGLSSGVAYGAVTGTTDGGFGSFSTQFDAVVLKANGTLNWDLVYMFGYQAHHELTTIGKQLAKNIYQTGSKKIYAYYSGCSEGGREGWSQVQRYANDWDGAVTGAPAIRFAHLQVGHLYGSVVENLMGYLPEPCELSTIISKTASACDALDGRTDGVVSRTDLCSLTFNLSSLIGTPYSCAASTGGSGGMGGSPSGGSGPPSKQKTRRQFSSVATPAQNGTISASAIKIAKKILLGPQDSKGQNWYVPYPITAWNGDSAPTYDSATGQWKLSVSSIGAEFVQKFMNLVNSTSMSLSNVTYDDLRGWAAGGMQRYQDSLHTAWPDLSPFRDAGGKVLHYHGESDASIPPASSVRYYESVRQVMYPSLSFNESGMAMADWYRFFLVPGAGHCGTQAGPWPTDVLQTLIDWVEKGSVPTTLNATVTGTSYKGENQQICAWPLRPMWSGNSSASMTCVYDQKSIDAWQVSINSTAVPVY